MIRFFSILLIVSFGLEAKKITIDFFKDKPRSIAKDFYIKSYLQKKRPKSEVEYLFGEVNSMSRSMLNLFAKQGYDNSIVEHIKCLDLKLTKKNIKKNSIECVALATTPYKITKLSKDTKKALQQKLKMEYPKLSMIVKILNAKSPFWSLMKYPELFCDIFNRVGKDYRKRYFDKNISKTNLSFLKNKKCFNRSVSLISTELSLKNLQRSLLQLDTNNTLSSQSNLFLALNAIKFNDEKLALKFLEMSKRTAYKRSEIDRALFWIYHISLDENILQELSKSWDFNIYSIYAKEKLNIKMDNIVSTLDTKATKSKYNLSDPFTWFKILKNSKDLNTTKLLKFAKKFDSKDTIAAKAFFLEKANRYKKHYLITPYLSYIKKLSIKRKALLYAIARQESRFIPGAISHSFALGMMQFMPFLAKAIAKEKKIKDFDLEEMFNVKRAFEFGDYHLDFLQKSLKYPLFIAYAYNGGIGFTRKLLKSGLFDKNRYDPFYSMELVSYKESREYGKKVLANYYGYLKIFGKQTNLKSLLDMKNRFAKSLKNIQ